MVNWHNTEREGAKQEVKQEHKIQKKEKSKEHKNSKRSLTFAYQIAFYISQ